MQSTFNESFCHGFRMTHWNEEGITGDRHLPGAVADRTKVATTLWRRAQLAAKPAVGAERGPLFGADVPEQHCTGFYLGSQLKVVRDLAMGRPVATLCWTFLTGLAFYQHQWFTLVGVTIGLFVSTFGTWDCNNGGECGQEATFGTAAAIRFVSAVPSGILPLGIMGMTALAAKYALGTPSRFLGRMALRMGTVFIGFAAAHMVFSDPFYWPSKERGTDNFFKSFYHGFCMTKYTGSKVKVRGRISPGEGDANELTTLRTDLARRAFQASHKPDDRYSSLDDSVPPQDGCGFFLGSKARVFADMTWRKPLAALCWSALFGLGFYRHSRFATAGLVAATAIWLVGDDRNGPNECTATLARCTSSGPAPVEWLPVGLMAATGLVSYLGICERLRLLRRTILRGFAFSAALAVGHTVLFDPGHWPRRRS